MLRLLVLVLVLVAAAAADVFPWVLVYSNASMGLVRTNHHRMAIWTPTQTELQCAQLVNGGAAVALLLRQQDDTDWLATYALASGERLGVPLQVHQNHGAGWPKQRMAVLTTWPGTALLYSPAGQTLLRYVRNVYSGIVWTGALQALLAVPLRNGTADGLLLAWTAVCAPPSYCFGSSTTSMLALYELADAGATLLEQWRRPLSGTMLEAMLSPAPLQQATLAITAADGSIELVVIRLADGQSMRRVASLDVWTQPPSLVYNGTAALWTQVDLQPALFASSTQLMTNASLPLRGRLFVPAPLAQGGWLVLGSDPQLMPASLGSAQPLLKQTQTAAPPITLQGAMSVLGAVAVLDWTHVALVQQAQTLLRYSLDSGQYVGYWPLCAACTQLLDGYNRQALLAHQNASQLVVLNDQLQARTYGVGPYTMAVLCGVVRVCAMAADGTLTMVGDQRATAAAVVVPPPQAPELAQRSKLIYDDTNNDLVLVAVGTHTEADATTTTLYFSRLALAARAPAWGTVTLLQLDGGSAPAAPATLPLVDSWLGDFIVLRNASTGLLLIKEAGQATWRQQVVSALAGAEGWRVVRTRYARPMPSHAMLWLLCMVGLFGGVALVVTCVFTTCLVVRCRQHGVCLLPELLPLKGDFWHNAARQAARVLCCCAPNGVRRKVLRWLTPDPNTAEMEEHLTEEALKNIRDGGFVSDDAFSGLPEVGPSLVHRDANGRPLDFDELAAKAIEAVAQRTVSAAHPPGWSDLPLDNKP